MRTVSITWHELPQDGMPDADESVLVTYIADDGHGDTWPAWWDGSHWIDASTGDRLERDGLTRVVSWAHMPAGSRAC